MKLFIFEPAMKKRRVTLKDIAHQLDVSTSLVSLVLAGKGKQHRISENVILKVKEKAFEMGYRPNQNARALRTGKTGIIGLIVADIANVFYGKMARELENEFSLYGYNLIFGSSDENPKQMEHLIRIFISRQVDGIIIVPVINSDEHFKMLSKAQVPYVMIDRYLNSLDADCVVTDNKRASFELVNLIIKKGYKSIGAVAYENQLSVNHDRLDGYKEALRYAGLPIDKNQIFFTGYENTGQKVDELIKYCLENKVEALFFINNHLGIEALKILRTEHIQIPEQMAIVGFDNPEAFEVSEPGVTCYQQPMEELCHKAMQLLMQRLSNPDKPIEKILLKGKIIQRNSI